MIDLLAADVLPAHPSGLQLHPMGLARAGHWRDDWYGVEWHSVLLPGRVGRAGRRAADTWRADVLGGAVFESWADLRGELLADAARIMAALEWLCMARPQVFVWTNDEDCEEWWVATSMAAAIACRAEGACASDDAGRWAADPMSEDALATPFRRWAAKTRASRYSTPARLLWALGAKPGGLTLPTLLAGPFYR